MELTRCDFCEKEIKSMDRHWEVELRGAFTSLLNFRTKHFCSDGCIANYYLQHGEPRPIPATRLEMD